MVNKYKEIMSRTGQAGNLNFLERQIRDVMKNDKEIFGDTSGSSDPQYRLKETGNYHI